MTHRGSLKEPALRHRDFDLTFGREYALIVFVAKRRLGRLGGHKESNHKQELLLCNQS
jgi:hypothetical protein